jgi:uncharacterized protein YbjT (DUF2867 family)
VRSTTGSGQPRKQDPNNMNIVIIGGTGLIGRKLANRLQSANHHVSAAAPSSGVDSVTGEGVWQALSGADVVIDVTNSPSFDDDAVLTFFRTSTGNLLQAAAAQGVAHYIALSVVGADRILDSGYLRAKRAQERLIEDSGVPYTIVRATQFFEFLDAIAGTKPTREAVRLSPARFQPVAADDVAATLADVAVAAPRNGVVELAGPDAAGMADFVRTFLAAKGDPREVVADPRATYFGATLDERGLAPVGQFVRGGVHLATWLRNQPSAHGAAREATR